MAKPILSDTQIKRRKKIQAKISQGTGALGLASVGAFGAARLGGASRVAQKAQKVAPALKRIDTKKADMLALGASTTGAGIGGAGSFNFARYTDAESRKRKPVAKSYESPFEDVAYAGTVSKAYDPEEARKKRSDKYEAATLVASGAGGAATGAAAWKTAEAAKKVKPTIALKNTGKAAGLLGAAAAATGGAAYGNKKIREKKKTSWSSYAKSADISAFGVNHTD